MINYYHRDTLDGAGHCFPRSSHPFKRAIGKESYNITKLVFGASAGAHYSGFKVTEVPCGWMDRQKGKSSFKIIQWAPKYLRWYFYALKKALFQ